MSQVLGLLWAASGLSAQTVLTPLKEQWTVGTGGIHDTDIKAHKPTYALVGRWSDNPNNAPQTSTRESLDVNLKNLEAKFQFSFKFLLGSFDDNQRVSLWAAYTQQSHWQVYSPEYSRPFRETNYEPEIILAWRPEMEVLGMNWGLMSVSLTHQSNGRANPLSRSWNRVVLQAGFERGNFQLLLRPWFRFHEDPATDDNPDLLDYLGHGEVVAAWRLRGHTLSARGRLNAATGKGSLTGSWSFPLVRRTRGHVQVFTGYGESLIDYNWHQNTVGVGISLVDWL